MTTPEPSLEPSFSTKPLPESPELPKKIKKPTRKRTAKASAGATKSAEAIRETKISKQLTQIYQDEQGHLPDMKKIKIKKKGSAFKTLVGILFVGGLLAAAAWVGFFFMPGSKRFSEDKVNLRISGPTSITAGTTTTYKIAYENNENLNVKKATLNVQYPEGFVFITSDLKAKNNGNTEWDLGSVDIGKKKELTITGITYGEVKQKQSWRVFLAYQPENFQSELQKSEILDVTTAASPFSITVNGSNKILPGNNSEYTFTVKKEADSAVEKLEIKPLWPKTFVLASSTPALSKDQKWILEPQKSQGTSTPPTAWTYKITGRFANAPTSTSETGTNEISGAIVATANNKPITLADSKITTELADSSVDFSLAINGSLSNFNIQPGGDLNMTVTVKNPGSTDITNAVLKLGLNGPAIQKQTLLNWSDVEDTHDGEIKGTQINNLLRRGEITWDKSKFADLAKIAKGKEVTLDVKLPIKDAQSFSNLADLGNSSQITVAAELTYKDSANITQTVTSNQIVITVNSDLQFEARDTVTGSGNGQKHQINWVVTNNFHPLKNITLVADVYGDVTVELPTSAPAGEVQFNAGSKKITWNIPEMPESVDVLALPITITVNKVNPTQAMLVSKVHIQAQDMITGEKLDFMGEEIPLNQ